MCFPFVSRLSYVSLTASAKREMKKRIEIEYCAVNNFEELNFGGTYPGSMNVF